ncbi:uncharacterized protein [Anser cygnoides]|uniref:uncharacterized protein isoform X3 n=1 Tax=Anser cygnoides TaxID=8845 RepID=UPI0034D2C34C
MLASYEQVTLLLQQRSVNQRIIMCITCGISQKNCLGRKKLQELQHSDGKYKTHYVKEGIAETKRRTKEDKGEEKNEKEVQASIEKRSRPQQVQLKVVFCSSITNL